MRWFKPFHIAFGLAFCASLYVVLAFIHPLSPANIVPPSPTNTTTPTQTPTSTPTNTPTPHPTLTPTPTDPVLMVAGDIAGCDSSADEKTANLLDTVDSAVIVLGDQVYPNGTASEFANCYNPSWGRHKARTYPVPGNHDYNTPKAAGYFGYFGAAAGDPTKGYYSFNLGAWHIIALNSNCSFVDGCGIESPQYAWLVADLAAHPKTIYACTLAFWHHPRFSAGMYAPGMAASTAFWQVLYKAGTDIVLNGHDHNYQRFAPQDPSGNADRVNGIRQFIVGTGGISHYTDYVAVPNIEIFDAKSYGVLKLTLRATSYDWQFMPAIGYIFTDSGSGTCH